MSRSSPLFAPPRERKAGRLILPLILFLFISAAVALNFINNGRVQVLTQDVTVTSLNENLEGFRILHISDLHGNEFGANQSNIAAVLSDYKYSAVCITGDVCAPDGNYEAFLALIDLFSPRVPVYFIAGDEDPPAILTSAHGSDTVKADYVLAAEAHGAIYLDAPERLKVGKSAVWFMPESVSGLDITSARDAYLARRQVLVSQPETDETAAQLRAVDYQLSVLDKIEASLAEMEDTDACIALTHHPLTENTITTLRQWSGSADQSFYENISLVLAGHYCAGQVRLPLIGALRAPASADIKGGRWFPDDSLITGLCTIQGITQYISPGLGISNVYTIPLRLFNTPSVTVLKLTEKLNFGSL